MHSLVAAVGFAAAILNVTILMPQVLKTLKTRKTRDLSIMTLYLSVGSGTLWVIYAVATGALPVLLANAVSLCLVFVLLYMKRKYG